MLVSKSVSLEVEDLAKVEKAVEKGHAKNVSVFVQNAVKNELKRLQLD
jgi:Arc/MetJ-type ribon-helix-helix transcriptional regulator